MNACLFLFACLYVVVIFCLLGGFSCCSCFVLVYMWVWWGGGGSLGVASCACGFVFCFVLFVCWGQMGCK